MIMCMWVYMRVYIMYVCACSYIYVCVWIATLGLERGLEGAEQPLL